MINSRELPLILLMVFTLIYNTIGNPNSELWSGAYFIVNNLTFLLLFRQHKSKRIRIIGIALSASTLLFIVLKFFLNIDCERVYTLVPFTICLVGLIIIERKRDESNRRKIF